MHKRNILGGLLLAGLGLTAFGDVINKDRPLRGEYVLPIRNEWRAAAAGGESFALIRQIRIAETGDLVAHDAQAGRFHMFSPAGRFLGSFGKKGAGPGEIKFMEMAGLFAVPGKWVVADIDQLHFFSPKGVFLHASPNHLLRRRPVHFLDAERFISAPLFRSPMTRGKSAISLINLKSNQTRTLARFTPAERPGGGGPGQGKRFAMAFRGVTPMMIIGLGQSRIYYGMNQHYLIRVIDLAGKPINAFGIHRDKPSLSVQAKEQLISRRGPLRISPEMKKRILRHIPHEATYFDAIESHHNLVFVWNSDPGMRNEARVDIFSPQGRYLYRGLLRVSKAYTIIPPPVIRNDNLYLILLDEKGDYLIGKYSVNFPEP